MDARAHPERGTGSGGNDKPATYTRHRPEETVLYQVVEQNVESFFDAVAEQGTSLPGFVRDEFDAYLRCGRLEHGFIRAKCEGCRYEHLVAFSCKLRGFCPSCGVRRMVESAAHLLDHVVPDIPMRQWVLSFPWPLRMLFAARPDWLSRILGIVTRALSSGVLRRAELRRGDGAETGTITFIQRYGSALNLNVHLHLLVPDGAYTFQHDKARFHRAPAPSSVELHRLLETLITRITRSLVQGGVLVEEEGADQPYLDLELTSPMEQLTASAVQYRIAVGPQAGRKTMTLHNPRAANDDNTFTKPFTVARDGFSLNCSVACEAGERTKLERVCRYMARPPVAEERLSIDGDGLVVYQLKRPFSDGTTHVLFEPNDFIARLAALVPRPRVHLIRYHGLFAPNARHRHLVVPTKATTPSPEQTDHTHEPSSAPMTWMARLKRVFGIDISHCPRCGGKLRVIGEVTQPTLIARILEHLKAQPHHQQVPRAPPALLAS
jgi:hypothetical protein